MTIRVGQLVIHTETETQETGNYQGHSHKAKAAAAVENPSHLGFYPRTVNPTTLLMLSFGRMSQW